MPASTPGTAPTEISASRGDWKYAVKSTKITNTATPSPIPSDCEHLDHRRELAHGLDPHAAGRFAGGLERLRHLPRGPAHVLALDVRRQGHVPLRHVAVNLAGPHAPAGPSPRRGSSG